jgi:hypothetical protein
VNPLIGFPLPHAEQASWHDLEGRGLEGGKQEEQPIFRRWQGAGLVHAKAPGGPGLPIEAPRGHRRLERGFEGRHEALQLLQGQAGDIQERRGAGRHIGAPYTGPTWRLLSWETEYTINRDKLNHTPVAESGLVENTAAGDPCDGGSPGE